MELLIQIIISSVVFTAAGVGFYFYYARNELLSKRNRIIYIVVVQLLIAAAIVYRYMGIYKANFFEMISRFIILECTALVAVIDFKKQIIPNKVLLAALYMRGVLLIPEFMVLRENIADILVKNLIACIIPVVLLILGLLAMKNSIGMGDVKLLFIVALFSDFIFVYNVLFYALLLALVVSVVLLIAHKIKAKGTIAFGPFLFLGAFIAVIFYAA